MKTLIIEKLKNLELERNIKILYASETGSRAWGFASPDSDYDIRFIYMHNVDWYLSLTEKKDTIGLMLDDGNLDLSGWELRKCLRLLGKSNAALIERFTSPIKYIENKNFENEMNTLIASNYKRIAVFHHHYSLAKGFWFDIKEAKNVKLKALFYLVRSLLSCNYILLNEAVVPMHIEPLLINLESKIEERIGALIVLKSSVDEKHFYSLDKTTRDWIVNTFEKLETEKLTLKANKGEYDGLEKYFKNMMYENFNNR